VRVISLSRDNDQLRLSFSIEGLLEVDGFKRQVSFAARLDGSGQVKVN
jgi:type VI secretion system protein